MLVTLMKILFGLGCKEYFDGFVGILGVSFLLKQGTYFSLLEEVFVRIPTHKPNDNDNNVSYEKYYTYPFNLKSEMNSL